MSAKHTPGPWKVEDPLGPDILSIVAGGPEVYKWKHVAQIGVDPTEDDHEYGTVIERDEAHANARLIAAAPDLLSALQHLLRHSGIADVDPRDKDKEDQDIERATRAALAKAGAPE